jgi:hypothetical protein
MTKVGKLTDMEAESLVGVEYSEGCLFNPIKDADGVYFISIEEMQQCTNELFEWVKTLPLIEYKPVLYEVN